MELSSRPDPVACCTGSPSQVDLVVTDLSSRNRGFPSLWTSVKETRRLNGYCEASITMHQYDKTMMEIEQIGLRAVKIYEGGVLRFYGTLWEPLEYGSQGVTIPCRDPYAYYSWRRVRTQTTYTAADAGAIAQARVTAQNALSPTHLRNGSLQASVNRTATYLPGKMESEIIEELAKMSQGYFFVINPVDGVPGTFAELVIRYPNAGTTHDEVRFEYGRDTADNLKEYKVTLGLPRNRWVAASSASTGGRITGVSEDTGSSSQFGIIEEETALSDISDTTLLKTFADGEVLPSVTRVYTLTPNLNSPLLHDNFDAGDFVRLIIQDGPPDADLTDPLQRSVNVNEFVRVVEASMVTDKDGVRTMESVTVETLVGGQPYERPEDIFRRYLDDVRRRAEMIERKVETLNISVVAPPATGGGTAPPPADPTSVPPDPTPTPAPAPPPAPKVAAEGLINSASGYWSDRVGVYVISIINAHGQDTTCSFDVRRASDQVVVKSTPQRWAGNSNDLVRIDEDIFPLSSNTNYEVSVVAANASGATRSAWVAFTTPRVQAL